MFRLKPVLGPDGSELQDILVFCVNFTPEPWLKHRIGVPIAGDYLEVINSDNSMYGGSGITNPGIRSSEEIAWDNRPYSIELAVPPLGATILKLQNK